MNTRAAVTAKLAIALIVVVMLIAAALTFLGGFQAAKWADQPVWSADIRDAVTTKIIDLNGDKQDELVVQNAYQLAVLDSNGTPAFTRDLSGDATTTMGNLDGDTSEKIVVWSRDGVEAMDGTGTSLWNAQPDVGTPSRAAVIRFAGGPQIVLGDMDGQLVALDARGQERWRTTLGNGDYIRGLDEAEIDGAHFLAAANHDGTVALYDERGTQRWKYNLSGALRRMRAFDLDGDGTSEIAVGGDLGRLISLNAATGEQNFSTSLGQAITEARAGDIDGDPKTSELLIGGKDGGVWALRADGSELWSGSLSERVSDITTVDVDDDGAAETIIGDESGNVVLFEGRTGARHSFASASSAVGSMDAGKLSKSDQLVVADGSGVHLFSLARQRAPIWYSPLLAGGLLSLLIAVAAWFIASIPPKPELRVAAEDQSVEGLRARRVMLHESLADVERLRGEGDMPGQAYLLRLKELRGELATTEAALQKSGAPVKVETFRCPNCGGALPLGTDRCDYCGQVVIA